MKAKSTSSVVPVMAGAGALFVLAGLLHAGSASAAPVSWHDYNRETVEADILPAYARLAGEATELAEATTALCQSPDEIHLERTRQSFRDTLNAWQGVSAIQFGPIQFLMRSYAIQYWPDRKSIGRRQLQSVLEMPADTRFDEEFFHQASVSIKGLPALEQLLFKDNALDALQGPGLDCRLSEAVASNLARMTQGVQEDWQQGYEAMLTAASDDDETESQAPELSVNLMKSLVEPVEMIRDTKLLAVMGRGSDATYPHRAESWMSGQSLANIRANIDFAEKLYQGREAGLDTLLRQAGQGEMADRITAQLDSVQQQLAPLGDSLVVALQQDYQTLEQLADELKTLNALLNDAMAALDIQLGFNSRDGD